MSAALGVLGGEKILGGKITIQQSSVRLMSNHKNLPSCARLRKQACTYGKISKKTSKAR
ncbi:hypothetical protein PTUN_a2922 [Pseudoalteromonas tunicata]|nr:hypothetical protein PTUN_a2922 [Pseudoalteromonas tunicata]